MIRVIALASACLTATAGIALADYTTWKIDRGWDVTFYEDFKGCFASKTFENGTTFYIGYDYSIEEPTMDVIIMNDNWSSLQVEQNYGVILNFGDETPWNLTMTAYDYEGTPGLTIYQQAQGGKVDLFRQEFRRESNMVWRYNGTELGNFSLAGSTWAMNQVEECQISWLAKGILDETAEGDDPFARSADPFSQNVDPFADADEGATIIPASTDA
jgi:hypothetical protein